MTDPESTASHRVLPTGVVTFLFTDIEGSTRLLRRLGDGYGEVVSTHHRLIREVVADHGGCEVDTEGDAFFLSFGSPRSAVATAVDCQRTLQRHPWPHGEPLLVRMGLHTGEPLLVDDGYVGIDVHRAARICHAAHGGQVLISQRLRDLVQERLPAGVSLRDLGDHWLKDLPQPERLAQLDIAGLPDDFPGPVSLRPPTNVPQEVSSLVGRRQEKADLRELVAGRRARLVTVTGPGGTGKTRLAAAVALDVLAEFPHGVRFVDLSGIGSADLVLPAVAADLDVRLEGLLPAQDALAAHIGERRLLLVLDNVEHVTDGAGDVAGLLRLCPHLQLLVTSRVVLSLADEQEYPLGPLSLPRGRSLAEVQESDAVQLFVARARLVRPEFALTAHNYEAVAEACRLLDGLPLAIRLAAARTRLFSVSALVERLGDRLELLTSSSRDVPARHRTLRATIDWSYALLSEADRGFFADLSVFNGGARLDSIEAVTVPGQDVLASVMTLANSSLLTRREDTDGQPRVRMLQTLRDYAAGLLADDPTHQQDVAERHALHYLVLVEELLPLHRPARRAEIERVRDEYGNVRAALSFWLDARDGDPAAAANALRLTAAMGHYWYGHGMSLEGSGWLERALAQASDPTPGARALALLTLGMMCEQREELERAMRLLGEARELYRQVGDRDGEAHCLNGTGIVEDSTGRSAQAEQHLLEAVALFEELGNDAGRTDALDSLATAYLHRGSWAQARDIFRDNLARDRASGNDWGAACTALNLSIACLLGEQPEEARPLIRSAMTGFLEWPDPNGVTETLESALGLAVAQQQWTDAARLAGAVEAARQALGVRGSPPDRLRVEAWEEQAGSHLEPAVFAAARQEGSVMTHEQAAGYALDRVVGS